MTVIFKALLISIVSGALMSFAQTNTNDAASEMSDTNAWRRSAEEAATAGESAARTTRDTMKRAADKTSEALKDAGSRIERSGDKID